MLKKFTTDGGNTSRVKDFINSIKSGEYIYPPAQRSYSYNKEHEQNLIISLLIGIPIDTISLIKMPDDRYLIADGMHRSTAISRFVDGLFSLPERPTQHLYLRDCIMEDDESNSLIDLSEYGCEDLYGKSYKDVKSILNERRISVCTYQPARPEDIDDVVVSIMKIKNKSTRAMPESRIKLVPILYANQDLKEFWERIDTILSEGAVADSKDNKRINNGWYTGFFLKCFTSIPFTKKELTKYSENIINTGNNEYLKYTLWRDLFAIHGHKLSITEIKNIVVKTNDIKHDNNWSLIFNKLLAETSDTIWKSVK